MSYEPDIGLARKVTRALREAGFHVRRSTNESLLTVIDEAAHAAVVVECKKENTDGGVEIDTLTLVPRLDKDASKALMLTLARFFRAAGLRVEPTIGR